MKLIDAIACILLIIGGLAWGIIGLFDINFVERILGHGTGIERAVYIAVGIAAVWKAICLCRCCSHKGCSSD